MMTPLYVLLAVLVLVVIVCAVAYVGFTRARVGGRLVFHPTALGDQWTVGTDAGPAVVTRVLHDGRGWVHEIETNFSRRRGDRGDMVRLHYIAPSWPLTETTLLDLSAAHLAGEPQSGQSPRDMGLYS